jgi:hypothetical protein
VNGRAAESAPSYTGTLPIPTVAGPARGYRSLKHKEHAMTTTRTPTRIAAPLQDALLAAVDALARRRACDIPDQTIARLVDQGWLRWSGGSLCLTEAGEATLVKVQAAMLDGARLAA